MHYKSNKTRCNLYYINISCFCKLAFTGSALNKQVWHMMDGLLHHTEPRLEKSAAAWAVVSLGLLEHTLTPLTETVAMFNMNLRYLIDHFKKGGFGWGYVRFVPVWFKTLTQSLSSWEGIFRQSHWFILFIIFCGLKTDGPAHTGSPFRQGGGRGWPHVQDTQCFFSAWVLYLECENNNGGLAKNF